MKHESKIYDESILPSNAIKELEMYVEADFDEFPPKSGDLNFF